MNLEIDNESSQLSPQDKSEEELHEEGLHIEERNNTEVEHLWPEPSLEVEKPETVEVLELETPLAQLEEEVNDPV